MDEERHLRMMSLHDDSDCQQTISRLEKDIVELNDEIKELKEENISLKAQWINLTRNVNEFSIQNKELKEKLAIARDRDTLREHLENDTSKDEKIEELKALIDAKQIFIDILTKGNNELKTINGEMHVAMQEVATELQDWIARQTEPIFQDHKLWNMIKRLRGEE